MAGQCSCGAPTEGEKKTCKRCKIGQQIVDAGGKIGILQSRLHKQRVVYRHKEAGSNKALANLSDTQHRLDNLEQSVERMKVEVGEV